MSNPIRVLLADDNPRVLEYVTQWLQHEGDIEVVSWGTDALTAVEACAALKPEIAVVEASLRAANGVQAATLIAQSHPGTRLILTSTFQPDQASRDAMATAGVGFLRKPFMGEEAVTAVRRMAEYGRAAVQPEPVAPAPGAQHAHVPGEARIFTVFSGKGGVGKSLIAANLAVSLSLVTGERVALVDMSLQFGDIAAILNLPIRTTISDLAAADAMAEHDSIDGALVDGPQGVKVLVAPLRPEYADYVTPQHFRSLMEQMKSSFDYIVIDVPSNFNDLTTDAVEIADSIVLVTDFSIPAIKSTRLALEVMNALQIDKERRLVLANMATCRGVSDQRTAERHLNESIRMVIPYDPDTVNNSVARGTPFVVGKPHSQISQKFGELVAELVPELRERSVNIRGRMTAGINRVSKGAVPRAGMAGDAALAAGA